jgi:hypothetical protein
MLLLLLLLLALELALRLEMIDPRSGSIWSRAEGLSVLEESHLWILESYLSLAGLRRENTKKTHQSFRYVQRIVAHASVVVYMYRREGMVQHSKLRYCMECSGGLQLVAGG